MTNERTERIDLHRLKVKGFRVEVIEGPDEGLTISPREWSHFTIGSAAGNPLRLTDPTVSRHHLELVPGDSFIDARNLSATNGSWCSGARFETLKIYEETDLRVGSSTLRITFSGTAMSRPISAAENFGALVGRSAVMRALFHQMATVAPHNIFVLITGETGTGKELAARAIHQHGLNAKGPFEVVDCTAIPRELAEAVLFGAERGAYTGAVKMSVGAFERAHAGTLFFDEIGELPFDLQAKLLRAIESKTVRRVGGGVEIPADVRIVAATNRNLLSDVSDGRFKHDLYHRLAGFELEMPALRDRLDDMDLLADALARQICEEDKLVRRDAFHPDFIDRLKRLDWPGNIRQLRQHLYRTLIGLKTASEVALAASRADTDGLARVPWFDRTKDDAAQLFEKEYLRRVWERFKHNTTHAAAHAGMDRTAFDRALIRHGLKKRRSP